MDEGSGAVSQPLTGYALGMAVLDDVQNFIVKRSPQSVCDDCIADYLRLSVRRHANHKTRELAKMRGFDRLKGTCAICSANKLVIRYA